MSASPAVMARAANESPDENKIVVPAKWRTMQLAVIGFIALLAALYALAGWRAPAGESGLASAFHPVNLGGFVVLAGLVWLTTPSAFVIARTTFQEALRRRWMLGMLGFGVILMLLSTAFYWMQAGEERNFLRDFGLGFIIIITMLMAIFLGVALVPPEIERRTIFTVLSKPVDRLEFLIGKFLGLCCTLFVNMMLMSAMFLLSYGFVMIRRQGFADAMKILPPTHPGLAFEITNLARALLLQFSEIIVIAALALALSLMMSSIVAIISSFIVYFIGQMASYWEHIRQHGGHIALSAPIQGAITVLYYLMPKFDKFDVRERLVNNMPVGLNYWWPAFGSGLMYAAILLALAYAFFSDREF